MLIATGDLDKLVGARAQFLADVGDDLVEVTIATDQRREGLALDGL